MQAFANSQACVVSLSDCTLNDGHPFSVAYTGSRPFPSDIKFQANLTGFNICYVWQTKNNHTSGGLSEKAHLDTEMNPFSAHLPLPYLTVINNTVERFITFQVVKFVILTLTFDDHWTN
jgi:hypothetical protein